MLISRTFIEPLSSYYTIFKSAKIECLKIKNRDTTQAPMGPRKVPEGTIATYDTHLSYNTCCKPPIHARICRPLCFTLYYRPGDHLNTLHVQDFKNSFHITCQYFSKHFWTLFEYHSNYIQDMFRGPLTSLIKYSNRASKTFFTSHVSTFESNWEHFLSTIQTTCKIYFDRVCNTVWTRYKHVNSGTHFVANKKNKHVNFIFIFVAK